MSSELPKLITREADIRRLVREKPTFAALKAEYTDLSDELLQVNITKAINTFVKDKAKDIYDENALFAMIG